MTKRLKVVVCSSGLSPQYGGSAISEAMLCAGLKQHCDVNVLCPSGRFSPEFGEKFSLPSVTPFVSIQAVRAFFGEKNRVNRLIEEADIVHFNGHWRWENYFLTLLCRRKQVPYFLHPRGMFLVGHRKVWLKRVFNLLIGHSMIRHASRIIALSRFETRQFTKLPIRPDQLVVLPNPISIPDVRALSASVDTTEKLANPYFLYMGRLESRKNILFLIEAFSIYRANGGKVSLLLVGPVERGYDGSIQSLISKLGLTACVRVLSPVYDNQKWIYYSKAKAVIYPTVEEPFGRVPFEAVACGTPCLLPRSSGGAEYLAPFLPQCIFEDGNEQSLAQVMSLVEREMSQSSEGLKKANAWVRDVLDKEKLTSAILGLYMKACSCPLSSEKISKRA